ncbi:MAG: amino acid adenylation domain-containing protein, partial [Polyangiales bacterium]
AEEPFDLGRGPLLRATLAKLGPDEHRLLLVGHHLVLDGWSYGVLLEELGILYDAAAQGQEPELEAGDSYVAYALERATQERGAEYKSALEYWTKQYADGVPVLELPVDRPRPPLRTYAAERHDYTLPAALCDSLRALAKQQHTSLLQLLFTSFQVTLARITNQWDLVLGVSAAGQASSGRTGLVGHAVSYLPVHGKLDPAAPFASALAQTKGQLVDAIENQHVSFGSLLSELSVPRDPSRMPLAPVSFNVDQGYTQRGFTGLRVESWNVPRAYDVFEIFANLVDTKREIVIETQFNRDLFESATIRDWLSSYEAVLAGVVANPQQAPRDLPVLTDAVRQRVLHDWNATETAFERDTPIHGFFEQQASRNPERAALTFEGKSLSYGELDKRANQVANLLIARGVGPEQIVGVCVRRSSDMIVAQLGVLKAGAAYLPLDPTYPAERISYMLEDSGARFVVSRSDSIGALGTLDAKVTPVLLDKEPLADDTRPNVKLTPANVAYTIYTSGSTGKPKGVLVEHGNFANFLAGMDARLSLSTPGVWLNATSIGFDISLLEIFGSLARGFTIVIHSDDSGPEFALPALLAQKVTHFQCTPSQATLLLSDAKGRDALAGVKELLLGGEAMPVDLAKQLITVLKNGRLINMYGPTETTIWSTTHAVTQPEGSVPIGKPIANTRIYILDERGLPTPRGAIGELLIGGAGVTRGYHQRPELTESRFVKDPFADGRMYKTGDLARLRADGAVEFLGRNDHQVKLRGYRIELGEIEVALRTHPAVHEAAVIAREDRPGDKRLVAYLVAQGEPTVGELRTFLTQAGLPEYMLPQAFVPLAKLPTTPNGKLDRRALPAPAQDSSLGVGEYVAPEGELEQGVAEAWCAVLGITRVGTQDNFFDLGGHSLLVVKLAEAITQRTGKPVAVPDLFRFPTVKSLANYLHVGAATNTGSAQRGNERAAAAARRTSGRRG